MSITKYTFRRKYRPKFGSQEGRMPDDIFHFFREGPALLRYASLILFLLLMAGAVQAATPSSEPTTRDLECMIYVTPDFQLLPLSAFSLEEGLAVYEWMCSGHLAALIPRGDGYEATIRHDDGTLETRYFSEFSNGQPFCTPAPGCRRWAYSLDEEEVEYARQFYGQEMSWLDLIREVAPDEYENMDYITRAEISARPVIWPADPEEFAAPWPLRFNHCSFQSHISIPEIDDLLPDLSNEPLGRRTVEGSGWKIEIVIQEPKDQYHRSYDSMADYYRIQHPEVYESLSPSELQKLESQPARRGYVNIETTLRREQQEVVRAIWGTTLSNEEYYTLLWPDLWNALPEWQRESEWADEAYIWREPDEDNHSVPNDYILPEDRLPASSSGGPVEITMNSRETVVPSKPSEEEDRYRFDIFDRITDAPTDLSRINRAIPTIRIDRIHQMTSRIGITDRGEIRITADTGEGSTTEDGYVRSGIFERISQLKSASRIPADKIQALSKQDRWLDQV